MTVRIISGERRGTKLRTPEGWDTRPLRGRAREALLNILRPSIADAIVLDAFAGSGAVGLEALSNGAAWVTFVEPEPEAARCLEWNVDRLRYGQQCELLEGHSPAMLSRARPPRTPVDLVLLMPPYHSGLCTAVLGSEELAPLVSEGTLAVCEVHRSEDLLLPPGWECDDERLYGITRLAFVRRASLPAGPDGA